MTWMKDSMTWIWIAKEDKRCDFTLRTAPSWSNQHENLCLNRWIRKFRSNMSTTNAILDLLLCMTVRSQCIQVEHHERKIFYCTIATSFTCKEVWIFYKVHHIMGWKEIIFYTWRTRVMILFHILFHRSRFVVKTKRNTFA